ncbi:hypothetical protein [Metabacillus indicus]|uniref:Alpha/beta hydrolase n=1 Tax=Metabacillus indicus TaxID=246786 RepID=A0A084GXV6_METID|nr:hypothetical protein [Metabacillus indicus]KEZ52168.1 hypothetical protein GS18_0213910 [Metabacillus indicus]
MKFTAEKVLAKYEKTFIYKGQTINYLLYPAKSDKLIVCFTTLGPHIYERIRMLWEEDEKWSHNILFISDNSGSKAAGLFYLGSKVNPLIEEHTTELIKYIQATHNISSTITLGSSMGGYAAIYYAIKMDLLGAIAVVPQICEDVIFEFGWQKWKETISEMGTFRNLPFMIEEKEKLPKLYVQYGNYKPDLKAIERLKHSLEKKHGFFIFDYFEEESHTSNYMQKELIYRIADLFTYVSGDKRNEGGGVG